MRLICAAKLNRKEEFGNANFSGTEVDNKVFSRTNTDTLKQQLIIIRFPKMCVIKQFGFGSMKSLTLMEKKKATNSSSILTTFTLTSV